MRRRAYVGGVTAVATLAVGLAACTGGDGAQSSDDAKPGTGSSSVPSAEPGTYQGLPEPCGSVDQSTLRNVLLPDAADAGGTPAALEGTADVTYDIDRRVGCRWKNATSLGSHHLTVDFERVVSYDPAVSDNDKATELYDAKALKAEIPATPPATGESSGAANTEATQDPSDDPTQSDSPDPPSSGTPDAEGTADDTESGGTAEGAGDDSSPSPDPDLAPRPLSDIGDTAYLNDELTTADSGVHRDITLVFRTGNVIVTVEYDQWSTDKRRLPDSAGLQERAQAVAKQLAERLDS